MRSQLKNLFHWLLLRGGFRAGRVRSAFWGPYRGLKFHLTPPMAQRLRVFYAGYEPLVQMWLKQHVQPGMIVYVVGAHAGIHVLFIARLLRDQGQVFAFEGWPENYAALQANIAANPNLQPMINPIANCISDQMGTVVMAQGTADGKHHVATTADEDRSQVSVPAMTLDEFVTASQAIPDLIVIDIEGHERAALTGAAHLVATHQPTLLLEHHDNLLELEDWLQAHGYRHEPLGKRHIVAR